MAQPVPLTTAPGRQFELPELISRRLRLGVLAAVFFATFTALSGACFASTLSGLVVAVADGDTLIILDSARVQHEIRLAGIDAPEKSQPFGARSKQNLAGLVFQKDVRVEWGKMDRYGRMVGKVLLGGEDVCLTQVRAGLAWHYKAYEREQSPLDREQYARAEDEARVGRRGLWNDPLPAPPWLYRHSRKQPR